ncbi:MAG: tRNA (cytidine(34)-2'-O)-methyltransferase [Alphaproteobacteria bacterium]|nr:tRNA (cytidine(34)-2'-O)-methyltransferase [Alphaproteobacteria bacterium]
MKNTPLSLVLYQTEIAQNMGAMARTCAALGAAMHVVEPLGFIWNEPKMRRAGMDYLDQVDLHRHLSFEKFMMSKPKESRLVVMTKFAETELQNFEFQAGDMLLMGRESTGVDDEVLEAADGLVKIPMLPDARSLNVAQSAGMGIFEALRQLQKLPTGESL